MEHIQHEEKILFPYIQKLVNLDQKLSCPIEIKSVLTSFSAKAFLQSHSDTEDDLQIIRKSILEYTPTHTPPLPYRVFLSQLYHFEVDLCKHAMIEDNVLIKKVLELEALWNKEIMQ